MLLDSVIPQDSVPDSAEHYARLPLRRAHDENRLVGVGGRMENGLRRAHRCLPDLPPALENDALMLVGNELSLVGIGLCSKGEREEAGRMLFGVLSPLERGLREHFGLPLWIPRTGGRIPPASWMMWGWLLGVRRGRQDGQRFL